MKTFIAKINKEYEVEAKDESDACNQLFKQIGGSEEIVSAQFFSDIEIKEKNNKIHNYKCDKCGKPATYNLQNNWHLWDIKPNGNFTHNDEWGAGENEFFCHDCYWKEMKWKS